MFMRRALLFVEKKEKSPHLRGHVQLPNSEATLGSSVPPSNSWSEESRENVGTSAYAGPE